MDPELVALAGTAGTTLVGLLTTEAWQRTREGVVALWRRVSAERAEAVAAELDVTRHDLLAAREAGDSAAAAEFGAEWQGRIRRLLLAQPEAASELRSLVEALQLSAPAGTTVTQHATASGSARVYQAGRDQNFGAQ